MVACGRSEQSQQAEAERISQEYQKKIEAEEKAQEQSQEQAGTSTTPFKLPPRPEDTPEPVGPPPNVDVMTDPDLVAKELMSKDTKQRLAAVKRLGLLATQSKIPDSALQRLINTFNADEDQSVVDAAARALGQTCHPTAMLVLYNNLQRNVSDVNGQAIVELGNLAGFRAAEALDIFISKLDDASSIKATILRKQAEEAKAKILKRNGSPVCAS
jgi:HEAT repeat protein